jgi:hypothetical protein
MAWEQFANTPQQSGFSGQVVEVEETANGSDIDFTRN